MKESQEGPKLFDRLITQGFSIAAGQTTKAQTEQDILLTVLKNSQVFDIQNVAEYFYTHSIHKQSLNEQDFPTIAPPFANYFMEFKFRKNWFPEDQFNNLPQRVGILTEAIHLTEDDLQKVPQYQGAKWLAFNTTFMEYHNKLLARTRIITPINEEGQKITKGYNTRLVAREIDANPTLEQDALKQVLRADLYYIYLPTLLATSFLHCKNISIETNQPNPKLSKKFEKRHQIPLIEFKTLNITPMTQILKTEGRIEEQGLEKALKEHSVRGHFAHYREVGMFGNPNLLGRFWIPDHKRGHLEQGLVIKDYNVHTSE